MTEVGATDGDVAEPGSRALRSRLSVRGHGRPTLVFWSSAAEAPWERRPTDAFLLLMALIGLGLVSLFAPGPTELDSAVAALLAALPGMLGWFWESAYALALLWALILMVMAAVTRRRRRLLLVQLITAVLSLAAASLVAFATDSSWDGIWSAISSNDPGTVYPAVRLSLVFAVVAVSAPHLSRPLRRLSWLLVLAGSVAGVALLIDMPLGLAAGLLVGVFAAAVVHLAFGSPGGHVPLDLVAAELADLGVQVSDLAYAPSDPRGVVAATGTDDDGHPVRVRIYGRDAWEGSLFASLWNRLWYRDGAPATHVGRQSQVEHEAFLTLLAERAGVPVQPVIAAGTAWGRDALLVRRDDGRTLADLAAQDVSPALLHGFWDALTRLHDAGIAHGRVRPRVLVVREDGTTALADLASGGTSPDADDLVADGAQLLVCTAVATDVETAVRVAIEARGTDEIVSLVPYLQPAALDPETRAAAKAAPWKMAELRAAVAAATGVDEPPLEKLQRVTLGSILMLVVIGMVAYAVISAVAGIGLDTLIQEFQGASWWWVTVAILLAPTIQVGQAIATIGASMSRLRFVPVLGLQYAISFLGLAVPASAAKIGLTIRFLQLVGSNPTSAVAISVINSLAGLLVQLLVIVLTMLTGLVTLTPPPDTGEPSLGQTLASVDWGNVALLVGVLLAVVVLLYFAVPKLRTYVKDRTADSLDALRVLRSPKKLALIVAGSVMWNVVAAMVLGASLNAFGQQATFAELILINTLVALFSGLMPIPGNIGVAEAALTAGLVAIGIPQATAMSTAIVYRLATFYIPPIYGAASLKIMRRRGYL